ncbi:hypothetical protein IG193_07965 [Infirmifilum lucidum]|uniref:Uncharacterized protein n=1 Tax=Infirmifilum lucidum TaxID=2776706 RepID=A0A7L9FG08_9CREN|nr:MTH938/NDUFAF3 family protein [Infirmifilum lucidum]QOJ78679.1 hypothetical protein IG193_07965 [Infirmifilum lucidum]
MIEEYSFGRIKVQGRVYTRDIIVSNEGVVVENWWRREGHILSLDDIRGIIEQVRPNVLVVGSGYFGAMKVGEDVMDYCRSRSIRVFVEKSGEAVKIFNRLVSEGEKVLGAFHLTC